VVDLAGIVQGRPSCVERGAATLGRAEAHGECKSGLMGG